jgi:NTE family protein
LLPENIARTEQAKRFHAFGCVTEMDIVQLIYRPFEPQGASKDYEFSRGTMNAHWEQGMSDASTILRAANVRTTSAADYMALVSGSAA